MSHPQQRPKVLALGSGITLLGVLRALSSTDADVFALADADRASRRSRWYRPAPDCLSRLTAATLAKELKCMPVGTVLMPCSDLWIRAVASLPADVAEAYPASVAPRDALELLVDKGRFGAALDRLGLPHPSTRPMNSIAEFDAIPDASLETSFLKPVHSQQFFARFGVKAFRVTDRAIARGLLTQCIDEGLEMMLQEYIPGPATNHYFVDGFIDRDRVVRALFARRRLRMSPPDFGNSTLMVSVPLSETGDASETLKALLRDIDYRGIFSAEFKRDARDGVFNLIEVNARPWWYVEFAARCGVNVCELAVSDAQGKPVKTITNYRVGQRCVFPYYDMQAVRAQLATGELGLIEWARSWIGPYQPVFRWSDPLPAVGETVALLRARIKRAVSRS